MWWDYKTGWKKKKKKKKINIKHKKTKQKPQTETKKAQNITKNTEHKKAHKIKKIIKTSFCWAVLMAKKQNKEH